MKVAFCGLGRMGSGMASRLVAAGHEVTVWNRTPSACEPLRSLGARVAGSPREASDGAEAIFSMVADDDASRTVWLGPDGVLAGPPAAGAFTIECSTLSHAWASELVRLTIAAGLRHLDAPVTGLPDAALAGLNDLLAAGRGDANETAIIEIARRRIQPVRQRTDRQRGRPRFVYNTATTLNGFLATPDDSLDWLFAIPGESPDLEPFMDAVTVLVVGRTTYDWVVRAENLLEEPAKWQGFFGRRPMFVFSNHDLEVPNGADVRRVGGPVADALPTISDAAGDGVVWVQGGGDLAGQFLDADALDQVVLAVAPVTLASGRPLLPRDVLLDRLRLREATKVGEFASLVYDVVPRS